MKIEIVEYNPNWKSKRESRFGKWPYHRGIYTRKDGFYSKGRRCGKEGKRLAVAKRLGKLGGNNGAHNR